MSDPERPVPERLFRYISLAGEKRLGWARTLIVDSRLYFARPREFNDPCDCAIHMDFDESPELIRQYWADFTVRTGRSADENRAAVDRMCRLSETEQGRREMTENYLAEVDDKTGVACFAEEANDTLMWAYYAAGHSGVAVRFDLRSAYVRTREPNAATIVPVEYADDYPELNYYRTDKGARLRKVIGTKSREWKHEKEWRITLAGQSGVVEISRNAIDGIVLGLRTSDETEGLVRDWIAAAGTPIELLRVRLRPRSFLLEVVPA